MRLPFCHRDSESVTKNTCLLPLLLVVAQPQPSFREVWPERAGFRKP